MGLPWQWGPGGHGRAAVPTVPPRPRRWLWPRTATAACPGCSSTAPATCLPCWSRSAPCATRSPAAMPSVRGCAGSQGSSRQYPADRPPPHSPSPGAAITFARTYLLSPGAGRRPSVPAVLVVLADGPSGDDAIAAARDVKAGGEDVWGPSRVHREGAMSCGVLRVLLAQGSRCLRWAWREQTGSSSGAWSPARIHGTSTMAAVPWQSWRGSSPTTSAP